jgi:hypothetical protein
MGDGEKTPLKLKFDPKVRPQFRGATIASDAGLLACRELDDALGLSDFADHYLKDSRTGNNIRHKLTPLLRQSIYSRLAGYEDTNDAERLSQDPAMRGVNHDMSLVAIHLLACVIAPGPPFSVVLTVWLSRWLLRA